MNPGLVNYETVYYTRNISHVGWPCVMIMYLTVGAELIGALAGLHCRLSKHCCTAELIAVCVYAYSLAWTCRLQQEQESSVLVSSALEGSGSVFAMPALKHISGTSGRVCSPHRDTGTLSELGELSLWGYTHIYTQMQVNGKLKIITSNK